LTAKNQIGKFVDSLNRSMLEPARAFVPGAGHGFAGSDVMRTVEAFFCEELKEGK
jgi:hypothetical protein